jgi:hypothetical protein
MKLYELWRDDRNKSDVWAPQCLPPDVRISTRVTRRFCLCILLLTATNFGKDSCVGLVDIGQRDCSGTKWAENRTGIDDHRYSVYPWQSFPQPYYRQGGLIFGVFRGLWNCWSCTVLALSVSNELERTWKDMVTGCVKAKFLECLNKNHECMYTTGGRHVHTRSWQAANR